MKAVSPSAISLTALLLTAITATAADPSTALGFTTPATKFEQSLPLGNGRMGAMIFGGVDNERIILNESSLWSGSPEDNACGRELVQSNRCHAYPLPQGQCSVTRSLEPTGNGCAQTCRPGVCPRHGLKSAHAWIILSAHANRTSRSVEFDRMSLEMAGANETPRLAVQPDVNGPVEFRQSAIDRFGGFARVSIPVGTRVIEYVGERISKAESLRRCEANNEYIFTLDDEHDLDGNVPWNPARLLNHSCTPNCEAELDAGRVWILALRDLQAGEELTFNYGYDLESYREHPCRCGALECVGFIVAEEFFEHVRGQRALPQE